MGGRGGSHPSIHPFIHHSLEVEYTQVVNEDIKHYTEVFWGGFTVNHGMSISADSCLHDVEIIDDFIMTSGDTLWSLTMENKEFSHSLCLYKIVNLEMYIYNF